MKNNNLLAILFCILSLVGCKDNSNETTNIDQTTSPFKVTLKFVADKKDDFCLLYTEDGSINF